MRTILITGGTGFIGQALVNLLLDHGDNIIVWTRSPQKWTSAQQNPRLTYVAQLADIAEPAQLNAVINLAGEPLDAKRWNPTQKQVLIDSRVKLTRELVNWCAKHKLSLDVWINGSAIGWYGHQGETVLSESANPVSGFSHQLCKEWEKEAQGAGLFSERLAFLRTGIVLEADGGPLAAMLLPYRLGLGGKLGDGQQMWSWIHRQDLIELIRWILDHPDLEGPVNGTAPDPVSQAEFAKSLAATLHRPCFAIMPGFIARLLLGEFANEVLLKGQRVVPEKALASGFKFKYPELGQALRAILR